MYVFTPQQYFLQNQSANIWNRRGIAKQHGLAYNEETATEMLLQEFAMRYPGNVTIFPFSHKLESQFGADWAWGFVGPDGRSFQGMLVQAKRLDDNDKYYKGLDYEIEKKNSNGPTKFQIEVLIENGLKYGLPPVYAFYNHLNDLNRIPTNFCRSLGMINRSNPESWGVTIASAIAVRDKSNILNNKTKTDKTFNCHREHSLPLHCLLCSGGTGDLGQKGSAGAAAAALAKMFKDTPNEKLAQKKEFLFDPQSDWPKLFQVANDVYREGSSFEEIKRIKLSELFPEIGGVVIFRDTGD